VDVPFDIGCAYDRVVAAGSYGGRERHQLGFLSYWAIYLAISFCGEATVSSIHINDMCESFRFAVLESFSQY